MRQVLTLGKEKPKVKKKKKSQDKKKENVIAQVWAILA